VLNQAGFEINMMEDKFWYWWVAATIFLMLAMVLPGPVLFCLALSSTLVGIVVYFLPGLSPEVKLILLAVFAVATVLAWRRYRQLHPLISEDPTLNRPADRHVGRIIVLKQPITNGEGREQICGTYWNIRGDDCEPGSKVKIVGSLNGMVLTVEPVD
jgi:membrane protein implicated in regulation of membrane protease activity